MARKPASWPLLFAALSGPAHAALFDPVWQLGTDDANTAPFSQESFAANSAPGSATVKDDDYYFAGTYPAPIGTVGTTEAVANFERAMTISDPRKRIHFPLTAAQVSSGSRLRITIDLFAGGGWVSGTGSLPGFQSHDVSVKLNGVTLGTRSAIQYDTTLVFTVPASSVNATTGENILLIERTGGSANAYIQFDYLKVEADPDGLADGDGDGMPRWFEETYNLSDSNAADAALDPDGDGLTNLQEFQKGTNPTDPDTDNDGLLDGQETTTDPLKADTDGDGIVDGAETSSNPLLADSDGDGFPDNIEIEQGTNPLSAASKPFDFPGAVGFQFIAERSIESSLKPGEPAGYFRLPNWNVSPPLPLWPPSNTALTGSASALKNHRGQATGVNVSWSYRAATDGLHKGTSNEKLLDGMIYAGSYGSGNTSASVSITGIPYATYDLIVYLGDQYPDHRGYLQLGTNSSTQRYFTSASNPPFRKWIEGKATTQTTMTPANYVRYRNLSGTSQSVTLNQIAADDGNYYNVSIHGFQIVDSGTDSDGDGMKDTTEVENGFNPKVADATADADADGLTNAAELTAGTDPHDPDTDHDGLKDGEEASFNANPLLADTDGDGLLDGDEVHGSPFPSFANDTDSDNDGFTDAAERAAGSDPKSNTSKPPAVPDWTLGTRTWSWKTGPFRLVWNHDRTMLGAMDGDEAMLCEAVVGRPGVGWESQIGIGLRYVNGRLTYRFRCGSDTFGDASGNAFWNSDWNTFPVDKTAQFGFSGHGSGDISMPLRFEFTAVRKNLSENLWTLTFKIVDTTNSTNLVTWTTTANTAIAADATLLNGTTTWADADDTAGAVSLLTQPGVSIYYTSANVATVDTDRDGIPDAWETANSFNPNSAADATLDTDGDGLNNRDEWRAGTNPRNADTDGDGASDGLEVAQGTNPLSAASVPAAFTFSGAIGDLDGDGLNDAWLLWSGGRARVAGADDDGDGMSNAQESAAGTNPDDPNSKLAMVATPAADDLWLSWTDAPLKAQVIETGTGLGAWAAATGLPSSTVSNGVRQVKVPHALSSGDAKRFYRARVSPVDTDGDGVEDWTETNVLGSSPTSANSMGQSIVRSNGQTLSGDALALYQKVQGSSPSGGAPGTTVAGTPSPVQAARFLMQSTFGPVPQDIDAVRQSGYAAWIDAQLQLPPSYLQPYIKAIKADAAGQHADKSYNFNDLDNFVYGNNVTTPFARNAVGAPDQLRQRVAFALSQILVVSRRDAQLEEKPEGMANYYDTLVRNSLGNYGTLLREVALHPAMGWYLSHVGNQKADPSIPRYPDENFAREVMQLFSIGLWELNPDGSRKLDGNGEPIPTYDNGTITEMARVFTGLYFDAPYGWEGGGWSDDDYTKPMVMYPEYHDFGKKTLLHGFILPEREETAANGMQDVIDAVDCLFRHPNTPPFVSRQLIQFLVMDNPSPAYVKRVQDVFVNDGSGVRGNLGAVVKAILLDPDARNAPVSPGQGKMREPVIRTMHLGRLFKVTETNPDFTWWNWTDTYYGFTSQEPLNSPSVFNFYTPVYQAPGEIRNTGLVSPGFQLVNTYTSVSFPNLLLDYLHEGFRSAWDHRYPLDYHATLLVAASPEALVDQVNLLVCAGNMTARTRSILITRLNDPNLNQNDRVALAVWLAMTCPEGAVQR
ncbi:DUF1800 family protein [Luteolibacter sp. LG18]|uniref:DUF1800 family protein n=1 Tax=Luteolibacter sp. LG18 TaxID=2819286 RepID=UPI002B29E882|nr:hypothetical protein llg_45680 [Luteolibacter sp. LG18]